MSSLRAENCLMDPIFDLEDEVLKQMLHTGFLGVIV